MKVLIACEFSGIVREAFKKKGHDAWSCDFEQTEIESKKHIRGPVESLLCGQWDMMIGFPPCTFLTVSANKYFLNNPDRWKKRLEAMMFVYQLMNANIEKICIENPVGVISSHIRKPNQYIQPWEYGHPENKKTGLWLKNIPLLKSTKNVKAEMELLPEKEKNRCHHAAPGPDRWKVRSRTFQGIADAMAYQWGRHDQ